MDKHLFLEQLTALVRDETNIVANLSNTSAFLNEILDDINWVGFYLMENNELVLGPFQGKTACIRIPLNKGVCGTSAYLKQVLRIQNVHEFSGHIACDSQSNSEIVLPILVDEKVVGVLDIDSPSLNRFSEDDEIFLRNVVNIIEKYIFR